MIKVTAEELADDPQINEAFLEWTCGCLRGAPVEVLEVILRRIEEIASSKR